MYGSSVNVFKILFKKGVVHEALDSHTNAHVHERIGDGSSSIRFRASAAQWNLHRLVSITVRLSSGDYSLKVA